MTKKVWKYELDGGVNTFEIPSWFEMLTIHEQNNSICMWVLVDDENPKIIEKFHIYGTGFPLPDKDLKYVGTTHMCKGDIVMHVFQEIDR